MTTDSDRRRHPLSRLEVCLARIEAALDRIEAHLDGAHGDHLVACQVPRCPVVFRPPGLRCPAHRFPSVEPDGRAASSDYRKAVP